MKAEKYMRATMLAGILSLVAVFAAWGETSSIGTSATIAVGGDVSYEVYGHAAVWVAPFQLVKGEEATVLLDGEVLFSTAEDAAFDWQPQTLGEHELVCRANGKEVARRTVTVKSLAFDVPSVPNPPTVEDPNVSIVPPTRNFEIGGGGGGITTSGSGTWQASASEEWIILNATSGQVGYPVVYTVSATTNVEGRTGYVYVSGHVHTVTQNGLGGSIAPASATFETIGGEGTISVTVSDRMGWKARANCDWVSVSPTRGAGPGNVTFTVAPLNEVSTRQGTLTVAGQTFTIFQYGRRMKLSPTTAKYDYYTHVIPITVDAMAITEWDVELQNSWISVVDGGNGRGSDLVTVAIAENPSWKERTGTVRIGTETFTVTQKGRTALEFDISPAETTADVEGANGLIAVTATPDLPWRAKSEANWLTVYTQTASGAGNGNVAYSVSPNSTLDNRSGTIKVTPGDTNVAAKAHRVNQPAAVSALSSSGYEFEAAGESCEVTVSVADVVQWSIDNKNNWLTVEGSTNRVGPGTVVLQASPNETVYPKDGTVTIARKTFRVRQKARGVEVEYDTKLFGTDGGYDSISIHPDGQVAWTAVSSDQTWITIFQGDSGTGDGEVIYIVSPYVGDGEARTGTITVGDKVIYITQRAYELSIDPKGSTVTGNNGAGEFGVSASIGDVWRAIVTEPWITLVSGYDAGTGNGVVRFLYTENDTGKTRTGKIIVAGEVYTLEQRARQMVTITATAEHGGRVSGGGTYDLGTELELTAIPDSGYAFSYWTGDVESMENPLKMVVEIPKSVTAVFAPLPIAFNRAESTEDGVWLGWNNLAWATTFRIFRGTTSVPSSATVVAELPNTGTCEWLDETGEVGVEYWYWIEAEGVEDSVTSDPMTGKKLKPTVISPITYTNLKGATNPNPTEYKEGTALAFSAPGPVTGYSFAGWVPPALGIDTTGAQTVKATWEANRYSISYNPNGGSGTMAPTACTYGKAATLASNEFVRDGWKFAGWGTNETSGAVYAEGQSVTNLASANGAVVTLYAAWAPVMVPTPVIVPGDGTVFIDDSCEVRIECEMEAATIYYSTDGTTPRVAEAFRYKGPFSLTGSATIKAFAVLGGTRSELATATITRRNLTLAEAAGAPELEFSTYSMYSWRGRVDETAEGGLSAESGAVRAGKESWMEVHLNGDGNLEFKWKVECEKDDTGAMTWDHAAVFVDGVEVGRIDGMTDWIDMSLKLEGASYHVVRWTFIKDGYDEAEASFADRAWVCGVVWSPVPTIKGRLVGTWGEDLTTIKLPGSFTLAFSLINYDGESDWMVTSKEGGSISEGGRYTWSPTKAGTYNITLAAISKGGEILATKTVTLTVEPPDPATAWTLTCSPMTVTMKEGESAAVTVTLKKGDTVADLDGGYIYFEDYTYAFSEDNPATFNLADLGLSANNVPYKLSLVAVDSGMEVFARTTLTVRAGEGPWSDEPPVITGINVEGGKFVMTFTGDGVEVEGTDDLMAGDWTAVSGATISGNTITVPMEKHYLRIRQ